MHPIDAFATITIVLTLLFIVGKMLKQAMKWIYVNRKFVMKWLRWRLIRPDLSEYHRDYEAFKYDLEMWREVRPTRNLHKTRRF
jgi:hypothetical protein